MRPCLRCVAATAVIVVTLHGPSARADAEQAGATVVRADRAASAVPPPAAAPARAGHAVRLEQIERELAQVGDEEAEASPWGPILTIAVGVTAVVVAATSGAVVALTCDGSCRGGAWRGATVIAGSAVATAGVVWLRWTDGAAQEFDSRRYRLERERHELETTIAARRVSRASGARALAIGVRLRF